jgi:hypothetical protein
MDKILSVGDTVLWSGGWGVDMPKEATIKGITLVENPRTLDGKDVPSVPWSCLKDRSVAIDLTNGHWAYGEQLKPLPADWPVEVASIEEPEYEEAT